MSTIPGWPFFDTPLCGIFLERTFAAIGEVCFVAQIATVIQFINDELNGCACIDWAAQIMVILAISAECCSYTGTFTTNCFYNIFEEGQWDILWGIGGLACGYLICKARKYSWKEAKSVKTLSTFAYCPYHVLSRLPIALSVIFVWDKRTTAGAEAVLESWIVLLHGLASGLLILSTRGLASPGSLGTRRDIRKVCCPDVRAAV